MPMFHPVRRTAQRGTLVCALWSSVAGAQSASLDPESFPVLPQAPAVSLDRPSSEASQHSETLRKDHLSVGALVGVGFPRPLAVEGVVKLERMVLLGVEYSALPTITVSGVNASCWAVAGDARLFPFKGPFFFGLRAGHQRISADASVSAFGYTVPASLTVNTIFVNPRLGFLWTWDPGITLGVDAGVQIPLSSSASSTLPKNASSAVAAGASSAQQSLETAADSVGQTTLPTVDLLRVGILF